MLPVSIMLPVSLLIALQLIALQMSRHGFCASRLRVCQETGVAEITLAKVTSVWVSPELTFHGPNPGKQRVCRCRWSQEKQHARHTSV